MASKQVQLDQQTISCVICLDVLTDPVTIPCGHSYCMDCIKTHWDEEGKWQIHSCPQCRQNFTQRPVLVKNNTLAILVEELKRTGLQAAPAEHCYAGPEDVACDVCTGRKRRACKSCLVCLASYCGTHLEPHIEGPAFKKHKLAEPSKDLLANYCSHHNEVLKMFCRTDQQLICYICSEDEHAHHDTVTSVEEWSLRSRELVFTRHNIMKRLQDRMKDGEVLQQEVEAINRSADKAVEDSKKMITELISLIQKRGFDVEQHIRSKQRAEVSRVEELQKKLEQEITELKSRDAKQQQLLGMEDHNRFIQNYYSLSPLSESTDAPSINNRLLRYFDDTTAAVSEFRDKLQDVLREEWENITVTEVDVLLSQPKPKTRAELLEYACEITLNPNSVCTDLLLSEGNRKATLTKRQPYPPHPERFLHWSQALSMESLPGRCYWEVEWTGGVDYVGVAYHDISRDHDADGTGFGYNDKSWALYGYNNQYSFMHKGEIIDLSGPWSYRIGVYLDHSAGILYFYSVSETITLLHRVQTTFTQPLYAGFGIDYAEAAEFCQLK